MNAKFVSLLVLASTVAFAQTVVNQGAPGKQGPWPVVVTGPININLDGGFDSTVKQGTGIDGGPSWNVSGTVSINNFPPSWFPDGGAIGTVAVSNFPASFGAVQLAGQDGGAWNVSVNNFPSTWFPDGGSVGTVSIENFPAVQVVSQVDGGVFKVDVVSSVPVYLADASVVVSGAIDQGLGQDGGAWNTSVNNFPAGFVATQGLGIDGGNAWNVSVENFPASWFPDGGALGSVAVSNFPTTQQVSQGPSADGGVSWAVEVINSTLQTTVNQGPGQDGGAWNVSVNNFLPSWFPDGGSIGSVAQGVGIDGGPSWNISGNVGITGSPVVNAFGVNSTQVVATLGANATYTGAAYEPSTGTSIAQVRIFTFSDVASAADGLRLQTSSDSVTWQTIASRSVPAGVPVVMEVPYGSRYVRTVYVNGPVAQGTFKLVNSYQATSAQPVLAAIGSTPGASDLAATTNSLAYGSTGSGYVPLAASDAGVLSVSAAQAGAWNVTVLNPWFPDGGAIGTVAVSNFPTSFGSTQGAGADGGIDWGVYVSNFPATQNITGSVSVSNFPSTWFPDGGSIGSVTVDGTVAVALVDAGVYVQNFPTGFVSTQGLGLDGGDNWGVWVANQVAPWSPDGGAIGSVSVSNFPASFGATQGAGADGGVDWGVYVANFPATQTVTGTVNVGNFPATQTITGAVTVSNFPATWFPDGGSIGSVTVDGTVTVALADAGVYVQNFPAVQTVAQGPASDGGIAWPVEVTNSIPVYLADASVVVSGAVAQGPGQDGGAWNVAGTVFTAPNNVLSIANSTTTLLGAGATWTGTAESVLNQTQVSVFAYSDVSSVANGLAIQFSTNGVNWDEAQYRTLVGGTAVTLAVPAIAQYYRVVYTNDGTAQGAFRLQTILNPIPTTGTISNISNVPVGTDQAVLTQSVITGITTGGGGGYRQVKVDPSGALTVSASQGSSPWVVSGTVTSTQGLANDGGSNWGVWVDNFPATWFPDGGALGSVSVSNFPAVQVVSQGTGADGGSAWNVAGTVSVDNFPASWAPDGGSLGTVAQGQGQDGGAWNSSLQPPTFPTDGGYTQYANVAHTVGYQCGPTTAQTVATMNGFGPITVGAIETRIYTTVCNSKDNDTATIIRCRADGTSPVLAVGTPGNVLGYGDCVTYPNPSAQVIQCIGPDATYVSVYECAPTDIVPPPSSGGSSQAF